MKRNSQILLIARSRFPLVDHFLTRFAEQFNVSPVFLRFHPIEHGRQNPRSPRAIPRGPQEVGHGLHKWMQRLVIVRVEPIVHRAQCYGVQGQPREIVRHLYTMVWPMSRPTAPVSESSFSSPLYIPLHDQLSRHVLSRLVPFQ
jgi:hypothetical protein